MPAIQEEKNWFGPGRDAMNSRTPEFTLADDPDDFVIAHGVNHAATGKAAYANISVHGMVLNNGVAGKCSADCVGTALVGGLADRIGLTEGLVEALRVHSRSVRHEPGRVVRDLALMLAAIPPIARTSPRTS